MFSGSIYKRCKCAEPKLDAAGQPVLDASGNPKVRELGTGCAQLKKRDHGSWYYYVNLPDGPRGERRRPRKGGFLTRGAAQHAAQQLWAEATGGINVESRETVEQFLRRWLHNRVDLKRRTRSDYTDFVERIYVPALGHLSMRELRTRHIQAMFEDIWAYNRSPPRRSRRAEMGRGRHGPGTANIVEQFVVDTTHQMYGETPKSRGGRRTIALDSAMHALLATQRKVQQEERAVWEAKHQRDPQKYGPHVDSGYVFTQDNGTPWHPDNVSELFDRLLRRLGMPPIRPHDLRHCAASLSLAAGLSMKAIQALLGHASFTLTADTYTSLMPQFQKEAADAPVALVPRAHQPGAGAGALREAARPPMTLIAGGGGEEV